MTKLLDKIKNVFNNKPRKLMVMKVWFVEAKTADEAIAIAEKIDHHILEVKPDKNRR